MCRLRGLIFLGGVERRPRPRPQLLRKPSSGFLVGWLETMHTLQVMSKSAVSMAGLQIVRCLANAVHKRRMVNIDGSGTVKASSPGDMMNNAAHRGGQPDAASLEFEGWAPLSKHA